MNREFINIVNEKIQLATNLNNGELGGTYYEAILIISTIISSIASIIWPGEGIDKYRFVELLIRYNKTNYNFSRISLPFLKDSSSLTNIQENLFIKEYNHKPKSQIFTGEDIDMYEDDIIRNCPDIERKQLRKFSYGNIFYKQIRSSIVHEYSIPSNASSYAMSSRSTLVCYNNNLVNPFRRIHFQYAVIALVTKNISETISSQLNKAPLKKPSKWWLDGG